MATIRPNSSFADVISILFYKHNKKREYLLVDCNDLLTLPCSKLINENWNETADYIQDFIFGKIFDKKKIIKIMKVWVPNFPRKHIYHVIFSVEILGHVDIKAKTHFKVIRTCEV